MIPRSTLVRLLPFAPIVLAIAAGACGDDESSTTSVGGGGAGTTTTTTTSMSVGGGGAGMGGMGGTTASGGAGGTGGSAVGGGGGCTQSLPSIDLAPPSLEDTGLYSDFATKTIPVHVRAYEPQYPLWSDGAVKKRWIYLPECETIDTTNMDEWSFPVGTRLWKEFSLGGKPLETRLIVRFGAGPDDFLYATYAWNDGATSATLITGGMDDVLGTSYDIPAQGACARCHGSSPVGGTEARVLGFGAVQLSHALAGLNATTLNNEMVVTTPIPAYTVPGTPLDQKVLGNLHANCGNCHHDGTEGVQFPRFNVRLRMSDTTTATTGLFADLLNQPVEAFLGHGCNYRIAGGDVSDSCVHFRMSSRGTDMTPNMDQMPPVATDLLDPTAIIDLEAWIALQPPPP